VPTKKLFLFLSLVVLGTLSLAGQALALQFTSATRLQPQLASTSTTATTSTNAPTSTTASTPTSTTSAMSTKAPATANVAKPETLSTTGWSSLWEPGVGGRVTGLAVNPSNPQDILVGGDMLGVGLSQDGGHTWQPTTGFSSWEINAFTWSTTNPQEVWVGTLSGPYESLDGGHTWASQRVGMPTGDYPYSAPIQKVLIDSTNPSHLIAVGGNQRQFVKPGSGALNFGLVYQSNDGGATWSTIANIGTNWNITDLVGSANLKTLYASVVGQGIYTSTDGGSTWTAVNSGLPNAQAMALTIDPNNSSTVWAAIAHGPMATGGVYGAGGIYKTTNGGQAWVSANTGIVQTASTTVTSATSMTSILRAGDGTLYTADQGLANQCRYESTDGGATWTLAGGTFAKADPAAATPLAWASSADGSFVIGGSSDTLLASTNHGASWNDTGSTQMADGGWQGNGFSGLLGTRVAFSPTQSGSMFLSGFDSGNLLHSTDNGASWTHPLSTWDNYGGGYDISVGGSGGNVVYEVLGQAGIFNGIAVSKDGGQTFAVQAGGTLPARHSVSSGQGSIAIASPTGATAYAVLPNGQLYVTIDTGSTWTQVSLASPAWAVASAPGSVNTYVATTAGIYRIANRGTPSLLSSSPSLRRLVIANGTVYGVGPVASATQSGVWSNGTGAWTRLTTNQWVNDVAIDPQNKNHVVYVTSNNPYQTTSAATGVWVSCDAGQTFAQYNNGLPMLRVLSVAFDPFTPGRVVIGTDGRGFMQTQLPTCS
jgi:photosystem II stability/assembly factor-like uncharacterized protein